MRETDLPTTTVPRESVPPDPGTSRPSSCSSLSEVVDHHGHLCATGTMIVHGVVHGDVEVPAGTLLVLALTASVRGNVEIFGRADIHGLVQGHIGVRSGGRLNLHGQAGADIHLQNRAAAHIAGSVRGCLLGPGRPDAVVTPTAAVAEHRTSRWFR